MSYSYPPSPTSSVAETLVEDSKVRQPYDALLVLDVEATCSQGVGFDFPNEIIVRLLPADYWAAFKHAGTSRNSLWSCFDGQTEKTTVEQASYLKWPNSAHTLGPPGDALLPHSVLH